jgi:hypothetical protein
VGNVDRYTATESLVHQSVNKWGLAATSEARRFGYVAAISEVKPGFFNVEEYRSVGEFPGEFPGGVETRGLPALALIFHPDNVGNFDITCEGLAQRGGGLAWQVHFRQRPDRPNTMKRYRIGAALIPGGHQGSRVDCCGRLSDRAVGNGLDCADANDPLGCRPRGGRVWTSTLP